MKLTKKQRLFLRKKRIVRNKSKRKQRELFKYYVNNPSKFVEDFLDVELHLYQKALIRLWNMCGKS